MLSRENRFGLALTLCAFSMATSACVTQSNLGARRDASVDLGLADQGDSDAGGDGGGCSACGIAEACDPITRECVACDTIFDGCAARQARVAVGDAHACFVREDGKLLCWGENTYGQLGFAGAAVPNTPRVVADIGQVVEVEAGASHTCVRSYDTNIGVMCFGLGVHGELGWGMAMSSSSPVAARMEEGSRLASASELSCGSRHTCLRSNDAILRCAGDNSDGQTGAFENPTRFDLVPVRSGVSLATGDAHTCVARTGGDVACWGKPDDMRLGGDGFSPTIVLGVTSAIRLAAGDAHTCALLLDGTVSCWGLNDLGQSSGDASLQVAHSVPALDHVIQIAAGRVHTCALKDDGSVWCWGDNARGELGADTAALALSRTPVRVTTLAIDGRVAEIASGGRRTCALREADTSTSDPGLYCWGEHFAAVPAHIEF